MVQDVCIMYLVSLSVNNVCIYNAATQITLTMYIMYRKFVSQPHWPLLDPWVIPTVLL